MKNLVADKQTANSIVNTISRISGPLGFQQKYCQSLITSIHHHHEADIKTNAGHTKYQFFYFFIVSITSL